MTKALIIDSSVNGSKSVSRKLTREFAERLRYAEPRARITVRDLGAQPIPHLTEATVGGIRGLPQSEAELASRAVSDSLVAELKDADLLVIGSPMYNFGMSSGLKTWFDHVLRAGVTFSYSEAGPEGLVKGKRAIVIETRDGVYSHGPAAGMDSQEPHIRTLLGFMGITDVTFIRAEGLAFGPEAASGAIAAAAEQLAGVADHEFAAAA